MLEHMMENLDLLLKLAAVRSDTGTVMEKDIEQLLYEFLTEIPRLKKDGTFGKIPVEGDPLNREVVWALLKNDGRDTVVFLNHHDAVDSEDYGTLKAYAYDPPVLRKKLKSLEHNDEVMEDLGNEDWIFGRGTADMKAGAAIQLNLLKKYCTKSDLKGNILFLSVPDEETLSAGMRQGVKLLGQLKDKYDLSYKFLINSEPHERYHDQPAVYDGSVGKTMAVICIKGRKSHIGQIFQGLNPTSILSRIVTQTEVNAEFSDRDLGEISPPPSWSYVKDFKESYDASVPEYAGGYLSFLTLRKTPKEILAGLKEICENSFCDTVDHLRMEFHKAYGEESEAPHYQVNVKLYSELLEDALSTDRKLTEDVLKTSYEMILQKLKSGEANVPESNFRILMELMKIARYNSPVVVIALSPPYYPHISSLKSPEWASISEKLQKLLSECGIRQEHYFMGISDNSYIGLQNESDVVPFVSPNMPLWKEGLYTLPFADMKEMSMPTLIVGPWGKDLHKITERVYLPDLVENTPIIIEKIIEELL